MAKIEQPQLFGICFACPHETDECNPLNCDAYYQWAVATTPKEAPQENKRKRNRKCKKTSSKR